MYRESVILRYSKGKHVLDIGSVGQDCGAFTGEILQKSQAESQQYKLWRQLKESAASVVGIDPEAAEGGDIVRANMETYDFGRTFEVIVAGDVIEHVSNQGLFLENIYRHLDASGVLILTTPNAKWPTVMLKPNATHTLWHDRHTLSHMLERVNFKVREFAYYLGNKPHYAFWKRPLLLRQSMLVVAQKSSK